MIENNSDIQHELSGFRHWINGRVQFYEVDSSGFANKTRYLYWIEWARTEYYRNIGLKYDSNLFTKEFPQMVVHAEIDYLNKICFLEEYRVLTRVAYIKNSSVGIRNFIIHDDGSVIAKASGVSVFLNKDNFLPERIPDNIRRLLSDYEGAHIKFLE